MSLSLEIKTSTLQKLSHGSQRGRFETKGQERQDEVLIWKGAPLPAEMEHSVFIKREEKHSRVSKRGWAGAGGGMLESLRLQCGSGALGNQVKTNVTS